MTAQDLLSNRFGKRVMVQSLQSVEGGCLNECYRLNTSSGVFFMKVNDAKAFPTMFDAEARGLTLLNQMVPAIAPEVVVKSETEGKIFLIIQWITEEKPATGFWKDFATKLASLHRHHQDLFGLDHNNYIGSLAQTNETTSDWISFFILRRMEPQLKKAIDEGKIEKEMHRSFAKLYIKLNEIFPEEKPSLVHGDLWSGNFIIGEDGLARLVDPAIYYGHREMDLAMSKLFGGFDGSFYPYYNETFPQEKNFEKRVDVYNLYPLLVHVNLFGGHYGAEVSSIIKRFV
ncbi:MAG: fructosamine kinase family protein [Chitinophagales bacterium]|nr:fructosamine kinase family protein [Chitinophagales bacterium]